MSEKSSTSPSTAPSNNGQTVQKKKSFRHKKSSSNLNRHKKSNSNLKVKPLEQMETEKQKKNSDKIQKTQVNKENTDNKKPEIEKKEVEKKKNRYNKKKSMTDLKKDDKSDTVSEAKSDVTSSTNDKQELRKSASKQLKKRKSKAIIKEKVSKTEEEQKEEDNADIKLIDSFLTVLSKKRDEMEKEEEEIENNPPQQQTKYTPKRPSFSKANKPKKEIPVYNDVEIRKVLDCYDFPTSFKTHNLLEIFPEFKGKFRINWINDSRALFIFDNEDLARAALLNKIDETRYIIKPYENPNSDSSTSYSLNDPKISAIKKLKNNL